MGYLLPLLAEILLISVARGDVGYTNLNNLQYAGCFELSYSLSKNYHEHLPLISLQGCVETCANMSSPRYVGIESSDNFCYCGEDIAEESVKRNDTLCNVMCSNESNRTCGGDWLMSLYDTKSNTIAPADHNDSVSFLIGISTGIRIYNSTQLPQYDTVMTTTNNAWAYTVDYHYEKKMVFANTKGKLVMVNVSPSFGIKKQTPTLIRDVTGCDGFAVDWVVDKIYWADCTMRMTPNIMRMDLDGTNNEKVTSLSGLARGIKRMEVDPYSKMLFWMADGIIESLDLSNKAFKTNVSGEGIVVRALALDRSAKKVYYVGVFNQVTPLFSMDYTGSNRIELFTTSHMQSVFGLGIHSGFIYWVNYAMSTDIIYKTPLQIGVVQNPKMVQTIEKAVWHMRVIHPDLQKTPEGNPCTNKRCSHFCKEINSTFASCQCPAFYTLSDDGTNCLSSTVTTTTTTFPTSEERIHSGAIRYGNATYLGCFGTTAAITLGYYYKMPFITLDKCISLCVLKKSHFAGIEASEMNCYCDNNLAVESPKVSDSFCTESCPDNPGFRLTCGGDWLMTVYDISKMLPADDLETDKDNVSLIMGHSDSARLYNTSDLDTSHKLINMGSNEWAYSVDYHLSKNLMFVSSRKKLYKAKLFRPKSSWSFSREVLRMGSCEGFAVDWVLDRIFWAFCSEELFQIKISDLDGNNSSVIFELRQDSSIKRMEIDPYSGFLFWIRSDVIESCGTTGDNYQTNVSFPDQIVRGITLDIPNQRLFYIGHKGSVANLYSMDYMGNSVKNHFHIPEIRSVYGMGILGGFIYWVNYRSVDELYKAPLEVNTVNIQRLKVFSSNNMVWHMRVINQDLQKPPKSDLCSADGSICQVAEKTGSPMDSPKWILVVVFAVMGTVMVAGLLMYLTEMKYWDLCKAKIYRVPYARENGRDTDETPTYHRHEDSVNLI